MYIDKCEYKRMGLMVLIYKFFKPDNFSNIFIKLDELLEKIR